MSQNQSRRNSSKGDRTPPLVPPPRLSAAAIIFNADSRSKGVGAIGGIRPQQSPSVSKPSSKPSSNKPLSKPSPKPSPRIHHQSKSRSHSLRRKSKDPKKEKKVRIEELPCTKHSCGEVRTNFMDHAFMPNGPGPTLIKYNNPVLTAVRNQFGNFIPKKTEEHRKPISFEEITSLLRESKTHCILKLTGDKNSVDSILNESELVSLLNHIFPPIKWRDETCAYIQKVSHEKSNPSLILYLATTLFEVLESRDSQKFTVDEYVHQLLIEAFDECIRQIILERPIRGILFRRIRDHIIADVENRKSLYISAAAYAGRKDAFYQLKMNKIHEEREKIARETKEVRIKLKEVENERDHWKLRNRLDMESDAQSHTAALAPLQSEKRRLTHILEQYATAQWKEVTNKPESRPQSFAMPTTAKSKLQASID